MNLLRRCRYRGPVAESKPKSAGESRHLVFKDTETPPQLQPTTPPAYLQPAVAATNAVAFTYFALSAAFAVAVAVAVHLPIFSCHPSRSGGPAVAFVVAVAVAVAVAYPFDCHTHPQTPGAPFIATPHRDGWGK
jgi:hypothetical protein